MILPVTAYGHPVLRKIAKEIDKDYPDLDKFLSDMFETMYSSDGLGLAAPQVNRSIRLFIIDGTPYEDKMPEMVGFKKIFINPYIIEEAGKKDSMDEGCLSIPTIREDVIRPSEVVIEYFDENWELKEEKYTGFAARVIQHEYDHLEGIMFTDKISALRKTLIRRKLSEITKGNVTTNYRMIFPPQRKARK